MRNKGSLLLILALAGTMLFSCSKKEDDGPAPAPRYPQLVGVWSGLTTQNDTILLNVESRGSALVITRYKFGIIYNPKPGNYQRVSWEIGGVEFGFKTDNAFGFSVGLSPHDSLAGVFDVNTMTLTGGITYQFTEQTGKPVVTSTFAITKK